MIRTTVICVYIEQVQIFSLPSRIRLIGDRKPQIEALGQKIYLSGKIMGKCQIVLSAFFTSQIPNKI